MKTLLAIVMLMLSVTAFAEPLKADRAYGVSYRPAELTLRYTDVNDGERPYLTVFATGQDLARIRSWFHTNSELQKLKDQSLYSEIDSAGVMFTRYAATTPHTCIRYQAANGAVIKEWNSLPVSAESFIRMVNASDCLRRCPPDADPPAQPIINVPPAQPANHFPWLTLALLSGAGTIAGIGIEWRKTYRN